MAQEVKKEYKIDNAIRNLAEENFNLGNYETNIGFEFEGSWIINPWIDDSGRFPLTDEEAIKLYGRENFEKFIELAKKCI